MATVNFVPMKEWREWFDRETAEWDSQRRHNARNAYDEGGLMILPSKNARWAQILRAARSRPGFKANQVHGTLRDLGQRLEVEASGSAPDPVSVWLLGIKKRLSVYLAALAFILASPLSAQVYYDTLLTCRTPGFWGTHAGTEKAAARDLVTPLLSAYEAVSGHPLTICGQAITNVSVGDSASAVEALCASAKEGGRAGLVRQLTATALNCIISTSAGDGETCALSTPCTAIFGPQIHETYEYCNAGCADGNWNPDCIARLDCFNNGGEWATDNCIPAETPCSEQELIGVCFNFTEDERPSGSPRACQDARKNTLVLP
jgi:hypothetical protein